MSNEHPYVSSYLDRHGKRRWVFRRGGKKPVQLSGGPEHPDFDEEYQAALEGRAIKRKTAEIHKLPTVVPRSLRAAFDLLTETLEWKTNDEGTQHTQELIIQRFLDLPVIKGESLKFGDTLVSDLRRKHIKKLLADRIETPHAASHLLRMIRKLTGVALDEDWIENDPCYRIKYRPECIGFKAWPDHIRAKYEARWPIGSTPRTVYAIALYFGHRRSDVAVSKWTHFEANDGGATVTQQKRRRGGKRKTLWIPIHPELEEVLRALPGYDPEQRTSDYIVLNAYRQPFSAKALSNHMREWTDEAFIPPGYTLHGLRKTLGKKIAERSGTTREIMDTLGDDDIKHAELYTREAEQRKLAASAMSKVGSLKVAK